MSKKIDNEKLDNMFRKYGSYCESYDPYINVHTYDPRKCYNLKDLARYSKRVQEDIEKLRSVIDNLTEVQFAIQERYSEICTAYTKKVLRLHRSKNRWENKVYYFIEIFDQYEDSHLEVVQSTRYEGKNRKQAFEEFEKICKKYPAAIIEKDIEIK